MRSDAEAERQHTLELILEACELDSDGIRAVKEVDEVLHLDGGLQSGTRPLWRQRLLVLKRRPPAVSVRIGHHRPQCSAVPLSPMDGSLTVLAWPNSLELAEFVYSGMNGSGDTAE
jgi:hypothetical protein